MIAEIGEALDIIKKCNESLIMSDPSVKAAFIEEMCDVLMYYNDILLRYQVTPEELAGIYEKKHRKNMRRDYQAERSHFADDLKQPT